ncbi:DUF948 domain-containing protein [Oceanobacillus sp. J11TS1]|uniref:DUF948 domain-containing protein n=1 Tax=Oceanobacillus sp. J11TS1 TaxID=2807191 RepID=UPI001B1DC77C|nr:DUF948 domain-containing protein [Oceanobacillus sp. J11TS1]GIO23082.1 hypothetical protein J11TS1_16630 [Oceanobacillus sp. J11TS1]
MTLIGIGVIIIGIACVILAIFISHILNNLASVLSGVDKTVQQLPEQLDGIMKETSNVIREGNQALADVNEKMEQLSPLFYIVGDVGNATRKLSSSLVDVTNSVKTKTEAGQEVSNKNNLGGVYGGVALGYYWLKKKRDLKREKRAYTHEQ